MKPRIGMNVCVVKVGYDYFWPKQLKEKKISEYRICVVQIYFKRTKWEWFEIVARVWVPEGLGAGWDQSSYFYKNCPSQWFLLVCISAEKWIYNRSAIGSICYLGTFWAPYRKCILRLWFCSKIRQFGWPAHHLLFSIIRISRPTWSFWNSFQATEWNVRHPWPSCR